MARRALLIGCQRAGLHGVARSLARLAGALRRHGFRCTTALDAGAATIAAALGALCDATRRGDVAVIVYVGHGLLFESDVPLGDDGGPPRPRYLQALVPVDIDDARGAPRVITGLDLAVALELLDARCGNATLILDCCHAVGMAADLATDCPETRARVDDLKRQLREHRALKDRSPTRGPTQSGPVRVLASAAAFQAYEIDEGTSGHPRKIGAFSRALADVLRACPQDTPWWGVEAHVAARLADLSDREQWIGVEGPRERVLFSRARKPLPADALPCAWRHERLVVGGGREHGLRPRDRLTLHLGPRRSARCLGAIQLARVHAAESFVDDFPTALGRDLPAGAVARRLAPADPFGVTLDPSADLESLLTPSLPDWTTDPAAPKATIERRGDRLELIELADPRHPGGPHRIASVRADDPAARDVLRRGLRRLGAWLRIRDAHADDWRPTADDLELIVRADAGRDVPLTAIDAWIADVPLHLRAVHRGGITLGWLHCAAYRVAGDRTILPLTPGAVHGVPLRRDEPHDFVRPDRPEHRGFVFDARGPDDPADEWLLFYLSAHPILLHDLATVAAAHPRDLKFRDDRDDRPLRRLSIRYRLRRN